MPFLAPIGAGIAAGVSAAGTAATAVGTAAGLTGTMATIGGATSLAGTAAGLAKTGMDIAGVGQPGAPDQQVDGSSGNPMADNVMGQPQQQDSFGELDPNKDPFGGGLPGGGGW